MTPPERRRGQGGDARSKARTYDLDCGKLRPMLGDGEADVGQQPSQLLQARIPSRSLRMRKNSFGACSLSMARCWLSARE